MHLVNLLASISTYAPITVSADLNFIGKYIGWLIGITGSVGIGVILFTLTLKLIVLPFDIYSKVKMKQNAVKMEAMRPELEKLQKQYANDKNLYNQKMLALQKKNGYSALSGCLPMILSIVIFMVAINAFRDYSGLAMVNEYNSIINSYNVSVEAEVEENGMFEVADGEAKYKTYNLKLNDLYDNIDEKFAEYKDIKKIVIKSGDSYTIDPSCGVKEGDIFKFNEDSSALLEKINGTNKTVTNNTSFLVGVKNNEVVNYSIEYKRDASKTEEVINKEIAENLIKEIGNKYIDAEIVSKVNADVKESYENGTIEKSSFLWVKNVWRPDVSYQHPILDKADELATEIGNSTRKSCSCDSQNPDIDDAVYQIVTAGLSDQKEQANGYFIFIALSIAVQFLSQFIMQKMQKPQLELQSVDGQAAMTQKMMLWMMPIMFGFFAFSYSTAFSIYMTISSVVSTLSGVLINLAVEKKYNKPIEVSEGRSKKVLNQIEKEKVEAEKKAREKAEEKAKKKEERANRKSK